MLKLKHLDLSLEVLETLSFSFLGQLIFMPKFCYSTDFRIYPVLIKTNTKNKYNKKPLIVR